MKKLDRVYKMLPWYELGVLAINLLMSLLFHKQATCDFASLIPILAVVFLIFWCSILWMYRERNGKYAVRQLKFSKMEGRAFVESVPVFGNQLPTAPQPSINPVQYLSSWELVVFKLAIPLPLAFVLFFSWQVKLVASLILVLLPILICFVLEGVIEKQERTYRRQEKERLAAELDAQKKREEMGYWK